MERLDKRWIIGIAAAIVVAVTLFVVMQKPGRVPPHPTPIPTRSTILTPHPTPGMSAAASMPTTPVRELTNKHAAYGTQLRQCQYPSCGAGGDVSNCPKYVQPTVVGEDTAIYAIYNGTIHDPRLKSRMCYYNPALLCQGDDAAPKTYGASVAEAGAGTGLQVAYGYNMRKALIEGGAPASM